jgi:hypothetical protein
MIPRVSDAMALRRVGGGPNAEAEFEADLDENWTIGPKVHGGVMEALPALIAWTLETYAPEAWRTPDDWELLKVRNVAGREVGGWITRAG